MRREDGGGKEGGRGRRHERHAGKAGDFLDAAAAAAAAARTCSNYSLRNVTGGQEWTPPFSVGRKNANRNMPHSSSQFIPRLPQCVTANGARQSCMPPGRRLGGRTDGQPQPPPVWETWTRVPQGDPLRARLSLVEALLASSSKVGVEDEILLSQRWGRWGRATPPAPYSCSRTITNVIH